MPFPVFKPTEPESTVRMNYRLDRVTDSLVEIGEEDLQALIDSFQETALDKVLDRFLESGVVPEDRADTDFDLSFLADKLDLAAAFRSNIEEAREAYKLPANYSDSQITAFLEGKYNEYIKNKKGEKTNENQAPQKAESETKQETVQAEQ